MYGDVGKKHRVIEAAPAGSPYAYLQAAVLAEESTRSSRDAAMVCDQMLEHSPKSDAATDTRDLAVHIEDEAFKADLCQRIYERRVRRLDHASRAVDVNDAAIVERALKINSEIAATGQCESDDGAALEAQLESLERRLNARSEVLRWGATPDEELPAHDSRETYRKTVEDVLQEKKRKEADLATKEASMLAEQQRALERVDIESYCRYMIVHDLLIDHGLFVHELVRTAQRDAELMAHIMAEGERRELARVAQDAEATSIARHRQEAYLNCVDPVMRQMRSEAAARREEERLREVAAEEEELAELEKRLEGLVCANATNQSRCCAASKRVAPTPSSVASQRGGPAPYWKKQEPCQGRGFPIPTVCSDTNVIEPMPHSGSAVGSEGGAQSTVREPTPVESSLVDATEVGRLLDVIDMAADEGNGRTGRGLGMLLAGIRV